MALTNFVAALPAAPGSIGTFDAAVAFGAKALGGAGAVVITYLLLLRFILYVPITVVGPRRARRALRRLGAAALGARACRRARPERRPMRLLGRTAAWRSGCRGDAAERATRRGPRPGRRGVAGARRRSAPIWPVLAGLPRAVGAHPAVPVHAHLRPVGVDLWGREIAHLDLVTDGRPVVEAAAGAVHHALLALRRRRSRRYLWLWIARAGGAAGAGRWPSAWRAGSPAAALPGVVGGRGRPRAFLLTTYQFVRDAALGNSEALLAALSLWAFERHLDGRRDHALYLGFAAALLRPEAWPFLGLYGLWLWFREPELRLRVAAGRRCSCPLLWFGPELWGSGEPLRASSRANNPNPGSAAFADNPGLEVAKRFHERTIDAAAGAGRAASAVGVAARGCSRRSEPRARSSPWPASALAWIAPGGGHDRARLRRQPALPDRDHRGHLRARRGRRRAASSRASDALASRVSRQPAGRAGRRGRRARRSAWSRSRR